ncbi:MAG: molybdopterin-dependent oxidoreductase, partial [Vicinamibacteria bacterium]
MVHSSYLKGEEPRQLLEKRMREEGRLPLGQSASLKWPVLHVGADPVFDATTWHFKAGGLVEAPLTLNWAQMTALPRVEIVTDFHCVTRWSTFDNR